MSNFTNPTPFLLASGYRASGDVEPWAKFQEHIMTTSYRYLSYQSLCSFPWDQFPAQTVHAFVNPEKLAALWPSVEAYSASAVRDRCDQSHTCTCIINADCKMLSRQLLHTFSFLPPLWHVLLVNTCVHVIVYYVWRQRVVPYLILLAA